MGRIDDSKGLRSDVWCKRGEERMVVSTSKLGSYIER
jgi:hypothetical protein